MANRFDFFFGQRLTEGQLDGAFDAVEDALWKLAQDMGFAGIISGMSPSENAPTDLSVLISGPGIAYDKAGQRLYFVGNQEVDCSVDRSNVPTAVAGVGNERWLSLFVRFERVLSDLQIDRASQPVYFSRAEGFVIEVRQGAEAGAGLAVRPAIDSTDILICDILLVKAQVAIVDANISTSRREAFQIFSADQIPLGAGLLAAEYVTTPGSVETALVDLDAAIKDREDAHAALLVDLADSGAGSPGSDMIGVPAMGSSASFNTPDNTVLTNLLVAMAAQIVLLRTEVPRLVNSYASGVIADGATWTQNVGTQPDIVYVALGSADPVAGVDWDNKVTPAMLAPGGASWEVKVRNDSGTAQEYIMKVYKIVP